MKFMKIRKKDIRGNYKVTVDPKKIYSSKITKKITRKGCRNVQLVWHEPEWEDSDGYWAVEKIHPELPATYVTKRIEFVSDVLGGTTQQHFKQITKFPHLPHPRD